MASRPRNPQESSQDRQSFKEIVRTIFRSIGIVSGSRESYPSPSTSSQDRKKIMISKPRDPQHPLRTVKITRRWSELSSSSSDLCQDLKDRFQALQRHLRTIKNTVEMISNPRSQQHHFRTVKITRRWSGLFSGLSKSFQDRENHLQALQHHLNTAKNISIWFQGYSILPRPSQLQDDNQDHQILGS